MLKPIDPAACVDFVHPSDTTEPHVVWKLRPLTKRTRALVANESMLGRQPAAGGMVELRSRQGTVDYRIVKAGLAGVAGWPVPWADEPAPEDVGRGRFCPSDGFLDTIPDRVFDDLALRIADLSRISEADAGKSSPPST